MATFNVIDRKGKGNQIRLSVQLRHKSKRIMNKLGIVIDADDWDQKKCKVRPLAKDANKINAKLDRLEYNFHEACRVVSGRSGGEFELEDIVAKWESLCSSEVEVEAEENNVAVAFQRYISRYKTVDNDLQQHTVETYSRLGRYLEMYAYQYGRGLSVDKFVEEDEFFKFAKWLREPAEINKYGSVMTKPALNDRSVINYVSSVLGFLKKEGVNSNKLDNISLKKIKDRYWQKNDKSDVMLSDDLFNAIMATEINYIENGKINSRLYNERIYLDAIKIILGHGFRYSDLFPLTTNDIECKIGQDGKTRYFFRFNSPKKHKKNVVVPFYPGTKEIIDYWSDKNTESQMPYKSLAKNLKGTTMGRHLEIVERRTTSNYVKGKLNKYAVNRDAIIPMPSFQVPNSLKKRVYMKIQRVWLVQQFGTDWVKYTDKAIGFNKLVLKLSGGGKSDRPLWMTLSYHFGRHTFISRGVNKFGFSLAYVRDMVGHSDTKTTAQYLHTNEDELVDDVSSVYDQAYGSDKEPVPLRKAQ